MNRPVKMVCGDTPEKILDAAEQLFIEKGFSATSLRAIASLAGVNLAATHYHFGSKAGLLSATVHRRVSLITKLRFEALDRLEQTDNITVSAIMNTFFLPFTHHQLEGQFNQLMGRLFGEPESLARPILKHEFGATAERYARVLHRALPHLPAAELKWRLHFVVGSMCHLLNYPEPLGVEESKLSMKQKFKKLHAFAVAGIES